MLEYSSAKVLVIRDLGRLKFDVQRVKVANG